MAKAEGEVCISDGGAVVSDRRVDARVETEADSRLVNRVDWNHYGIEVHSDRERGWLELEKLLLAPPDRMQARLDFLINWVSDAHVFDDKLGFYDYGISRHAFWTKDEQPVIKLPLDLAGIRSQLNELVAQAVFGEKLGKEWGVKMAKTEVAFSSEGVPIIVMEKVIEPALREVDNEGRIQPDRVRRIKQICEEAQDQDTQLLEILTQCGVTKAGDIVAFDGGGFDDRDTLKAEAARAIVPERVSKIFLG